MVKMKSDRDKLTKILREAIVSLCNSGLNYNLELSVEGLLGITLDKREVFLVNIQEIIKSQDESRDQSPKRHSSESYSQKKKKKASSPSRRESAESAEVYEVGDETGSESQGPVTHEESHVQQAEGDQPQTVSAAECQASPTPSPSKRTVQSSSHNTTTHSPAKQQCLETTQSAVPYTTTSPVASGSATNDFEPTTTDTNSELHVPAFSIKQEISEADYLGMEPQGYGDPYTDSMSMNSASYGDTFTDASQGASFDASLGVQPMYITDAHTGQVLGTTTPKVVCAHMDIKPLLRETQLETEMSVPHTNKHTQEDALQSLCSRENSAEERGPLYNQTEIYDMATQKPTRKIAKRKSKISGKDDQQNVVRPITSMHSLRSRDNSAKERGPQYNQTEIYDMATQKPTRKIAKRKSKINGKDDQQNVVHPITSKSKWGSRAHQNKNKSNLKSQYKHKNKPPRKFKLYPQKHIKEAVRSVVSGKMTAWEASFAYNVPRTTIRNRCKKLHLM